MALIRRAIRPPRLAGGIPAETTRQPAQGSPVPVREIRGPEPALAQSRQTSLSRRRTPRRVVSLGGRRRPLRNLTSTWLTSHRRTRRSRRPTRRMASVVPPRRSRPRCRRLRQARPTRRRSRPSARCGDGCKRRQGRRPAQTWGLEVGLIDGHPAVDRKSRRRERIGRPVDRDADVLAALTSVFSVPLGKHRGRKPFPTSRVLSRTPHCEASPTFRGTLRGDSLIEG